VIDEYWLVDFFSSLAIARPCIVPLLYMAFTGTLATKYRVRVVNKRKVEEILDTSRISLVGLL